MSVVFPHPPTHTHTYRHTHTHTHITISTVHSQAYFFCEYTTVQMNKTRQEGKKASLFMSHRHTHTHRERERCGPAVLTSLSPHAGTLGEQQQDALGGKQMPPPLPHNQVFFC